IPVLAGVISNRCWNLAWGVASPDGAGVQHSRASHLKPSGSVTPSHKEYRGVFIPNPARWLESGTLSEARTGGLRCSRQTALQARLQPPAPPKHQNVTALAGLGSTPVLQSMAI